MLNVVTGLVFILLLYSLLATTVMEIIASIFSLRGRNLEQALSRILSSPKKNGQLFKEFTQNVMYRQIQSKFFIWKRPPSYLGHEMFSSILWDTLLKDTNNENIEQRIQAIPNNDLKKTLIQLNNESEGDIKRFRYKVENWYNQVMERASGWYKRNTQFILIVVGICIAIIFNVDTISIFDKLSKDPEAQLEFVSLSQNLVSNQPSVNDQGYGLHQQLDDQVNSILLSNLQNMEQPLGLGWNNFSALPQDYNEWLYRVLGWLTTALAISLGAPFWFDLLRRLVNIRSSGNVPASPPKNVPQSYD